MLPFVGTKLPRLTPFRVTLTALAAEPGAKTTPCEPLTPLTARPVMPPWPLLSASTVAREMVIVWLAVGLDVPYWSVANTETGKGPVEVVYVYVSVILVLLVVAGTVKVLPSPQLIEYV